VFQKANLIKDYKILNGMMYISLVDRYKICLTKSALRAVTVSLGK